MPSLLTRRPSGTIPLHNSAVPRRAGGGKQARGRGDWTLVWPIRGGGSDGEASGDGCQRGSGNTAAAARVAVKRQRC
jgi:hypothetical protein